MFSFKAYFWKNNIYINGQYKYAANEILTAYLNSDYYEYIEEEDIIYNLERLKKKMIITEDMDYEYYENYSSNGENAIYLFSQINNRIAVLTPYDKILQDQIYTFEDLQSFLYYDFLSGVKKNYIPNRCKLCGAFFLIRGGKYFSYCDRPFKDEPDKTCRDVGARRRYDDKCKNDPIWQTYNRAYKAHYTRYLKKKMTAAQFEEWSRFASILRDSAEEEKISFDDYYTEIRK